MFRKRRREMLAGSVCLVGTEQPNGWAGPNCKLNIIATKESCDRYLP